MAHRWAEEEFAGHLNLRLWVSIFRRARPYWKYFFGVWAQAIGNGLVEAAFGLAIWQMLHFAMGGQPTQAILWGGGYLGLVSVQSLSTVVFILLAGKCSTGVAHDIRRDSFAKLQTLEFAFFDHRPVGWLMARLTSDCQRLAGLLSWSLPDLIWGPTMMICVAGAMLWMDWRLTLVVFAVIPPLVVVSVIFQRLILHTSRQVRKINSQLTAGYNESIMGARTTKTLVREQANLAEFEQLSGEMYGVSIRNALRSTIYMPIVQAISSIGVGLALWYGGGRTLAEPAGLSLPTLLAFIYYVERFFGPIHETARVFNDLLSAQAAAERVDGLLTTAPAIKDSPAVAAAIAANAGQPTAPGIAIDGGPNALDHIEFRGVNFAYVENQPVLKDFNLTVTAGQTIALVGPTGGGKTTIISLLCRFYEPTAGAGKVLLNGVDYRDRSLLWLQSNLGIVLQTPHLFNGTVRENIRYGRLAASDDEVVAAARLVNAHEFIVAMDKGYDSEVGPGGNKLSVGQRQLISFARAVLADPQIFVMDEATSSVDTETEKAIQAGLAAVLRGRISFIVAHRLSTIRSANLIVVIDGGQIIERGTHHELIRLRGRYYQLYTNQFTREKEAELLGPEKWGSNEEGLGVRD